jgi:hypothetical protein
LEAIRSLVLFHYQAAVAYRNGNEPEEAAKHLKKGQAYISSLTRGEQTLIRTDYLLEEAAVKMALGLPLAQVPVQEYAEMCQPLEVAMDELKEMMEEEGARAVAAAWRWLDVSNDLARMDRLRDDLEGAKERYDSNLLVCDQARFREEPSIRRMRAISLNGLGIIAEEFFTEVVRVKANPSDRDDKHWMEGVQLDEMPFLEQMLELYEETYRIREKLWESEEDRAIEEHRRADPWIAHELAYAFANLADAYWDRWRISDRSPADWKRAYIMMGKRKRLHEMLHNQDPGNKYFRRGCAHGISNLAYFQATTMEASSDEDISNWVVELEVAHQLAPEERPLKRKLDEVKKLQTKRKELEKSSTP